MKGIDKKLIIFTTKKRFNDRNADDMQSGDMDADILKKHYHLGQVSTFIDWTTLVPPISILLLILYSQLVEKKPLRCYMMSYALSPMPFLSEDHTRA